MKTLTGNIVPWFAGTLLAFVGVAVARLLAPSLNAGTPQLLVTLGGRLLALAGLAVILVGIHRRLRAEGAGTTPEDTPHSSE
jgi:hypothetical protein